MSVRVRRLADRIDAWLDGRLIVGETLREGLSSLGNRRSISIHIDELIGATWPPMTSELLRTALDAFVLLAARLPRKKSAAALIILTIPVKRVRFRSGSTVNFSAIRRHLEEEPPELFVHPHRVMAPLRKWLRSCVALDRADDVGGGTLVGVPQKKGAVPRREAISVETLVLFAETGS